MCAFEILKKGNNVFLTGNAGTGKSYILNDYMDYCLNERKNIIVTAPTGIAAINIGGATLHRTFYAPLHPIPDNQMPRNVKDAVCDADVIVIDEISMCRSDLFGYVIRCIDKAAALSKKHKNKQIIVCGDFFQLPPVCTPKDTAFLPELSNRLYAFQTKEWVECNFTNILLTEIVRQKDMAFAVNLDKIRKGDFSGVYWIRDNASKEEIPGGITLAPTNQLVSEINEQESGKLDTEFKIYTSDIDGDVNSGDKFTEDYLDLAEGIRVMSVVNDTNGYYQNGSLGTVVKCKKDSVVVDFDNGNRCEIEPYTANVNDYTVDEKGKVTTEIVGSFCQLPLKIAYATTIHKSQGKTFDAVNLYPNCFADGQLYVALSRVTNIKGLHLKDYISKRSLKTSNAVIDFYHNLDIAEMNLPAETYVSDNIKGEMITLSVPVDIYDKNGDKMDIVIPEYLAEVVSEYIRDKNKSGYAN